MKLQSSDGAMVGLVPVRFQFPDIGGLGPNADYDWDANWLVIRGDAQMADGRKWSFEDACLTTWEARELCSWLRGVVAGVVKPTRFDEEVLKVFTEPSVAFSLAARDDTRATIRVHFSLEARPPWLPEVDPGGLFEFFIEVSAALADFAVAVDEWERELVAFPVR